MGVYEVIEQAKKGFCQMTTLKLNAVVGVSKDEERGKWKVMMELIERASIPDSQDVLGIYEVEVDEKGEISGFMKKGMRRRGETKTGLPEEEK